MNEYVIFVHYLLFEKFISLNFYLFYFPGAAAEPLGSARGAQVGNLCSKLYAQPVVPPQCDIGKKGKAIPLQAWTGPEGSRRLRFQDFKTFST